MNRKQKLMMTLMGGNPPQFTYQVTVTAGQATTPKFTFAAGAPAAAMSWGDGSALEAVTSGTELNHAYTNAGTYTVKLIAPGQAHYLTMIDIREDKVSYVLTPIQNFPNLTGLRGETNSAWTQDISSWQFSALMEEFWVNSTGVTGTTSSWIIPASMHFLILGATVLTGCPVLSSMVAMETLYLLNSALPQASVDLYLSRCVAIEASTTYATPTLNLGGTNQAPSAQGVTDKNTLVAAGWVVTVTA